MGVYLKYINSDKIFNDTTCQRIILNDLPNRTTRDKSNINNLLMLEVGEVFDNVPRCSCGFLSMKMLKGTRCTQCDTLVEEVVADQLDNKVWVRAPEGVPALMNPKIWHQLQEYLNKSRFRFNLLQYLTDRSYRPKLTTPTGPIKVLLAKLDQLGINIRSYQNFYDHFDEYVEILLTNKEFNPHFKEKGAELLKIIKENRDCVWVKYLQIPNRALTIVENSNGKKWIDNSTPELMKAVRLMVGIDNEDNPTSIETKCNRASKFLSNLGMYYDTKVNTEILGKKQGLIRKHILATRSNFSARFVVTAIVDDHYFDEVHFPWAGFMNMFSPHIKAKLYNKYGFNSKKIMKIMTRYQNEYHPELYAIFNELINESKAPNGKVGIPVDINRNPTLKHGSIVLLRLTKVKTDTRDMSASTSGSIAALYNGDYDGDVETFLALLDNRTARAFQPFEARYSVNDLLNPYSASSVVNLPKPTVMTIAAFANQEGNKQTITEDEKYMSQFLA